MTGRAEDAKPAAPIGADGSMTPGRRGAAAQAPEPLLPVDPKAHESFKPGSKVE